MKSQVTWRVRGLGLVLLGLLVGPGCQSIYNSTLENVFGYEKRELFKKSVTSLQSEQKEAQKEFKDALTRLKELYAFQGGELESVYQKVKNSYDRCESEAKDVSSRIGTMEDLATAMFREWEQEIKQYTNPNLAASSREQLRNTKDRYAQLSRTVRAAEAAMQPVLAQLKDNVLFLKHNLNASAIGSLQGEATSIQAQIEQLLSRMNASIAESDSFIKTLPK
jgi:predicted  nucleic acid-binding Zn-ribbon protein